MGNKKPKQPKPEVYLLNGKKDQCWDCKAPLSSVTHTFSLTRVGTNEKKRIEESILFCPSCQKYYVSQEMCKSLAHKYPKYFLNVAISSVKSKRTASPQAIADVPQKSTIQEHKEQPPSPTEITDTPRNTETKPVSGITVPVYLSNTYGIHNKVCPQRNSTTTMQQVNIPVLLENGDFHRYYTGDAMFCNNCKCGYITQTTADLILKRVQRPSAEKRTIRLANVEVSYGLRDDKYLYHPTLDNKSAIYSPGFEWEKASSHESIELRLNSESFLHKMGYSVQEPESVRHAILMKAAKEFGKRRVVDHLTFLIDTRRSQSDGPQKYKNAINIWQRDKNFIISAEL